jgi:glycosyltransferase involved in cell wall biosynthesis
MSDGVVRWPDGQAAAGRVAVVTVSYNTRELTALLLWSLRRILRWEALEIVVVDNGSADGSAQLLATIAAAGGCRLIANAGNAMHGPALNQAMSFLASRGSELPRWVWVLDSDVVVSRPDALEEAVRRAEETGAAITGESWWDSWDKTYSFLRVLVRARPLPHSPRPEQPVRRVGVRRQRAPVLRLGPRPPRAALRSRRGRRRQAR